MPLFIRVHREAVDNFDQDLLEKLYCEQIGRRRWSVLSGQQKRNEAYQDGLQDSNFDKLMKALEYRFGGKSTQLRIINLQINTTLQSLLTRPIISGGIALFREVHEKRNLDLVASFWETYCTSLEDEVFDKLEDDFLRGIERLAEPMNELISYHNVLTCFPDWNDEPDRGIEKMITLVNRYVAHLLKMRMNEQGNDINNLSSHDWIAIWGSVLLISYSKVFCQTFGQEKIIIESLLHEEHFRRLGHVNRKCPGCTQDLRSSSITIVKKVSETVHTCTPCMKCFATVENELRRCPRCAVGFESSKWANDLCPSPSCRLTSQKMIVSTTSNGPMECNSCRQILQPCQLDVDISKNEPVDCCQRCATVYSFKSIRMGIITSRPCPHCLQNGHGQTAWTAAGDKCPGCKKASHFQPPTFLDPGYNATGELMPFSEMNGVGCRINITVPADMSNTSHVAHIIWKYCDFVESLEQRKSGPT